MHRSVAGGLFAMSADRRGRDVAGSEGRQRKMHAAWPPLPSVADEASGVSYSSCDTLGSSPCYFLTNLTSCQDLIGFSVFMRGAAAGFLEKALLAIWDGDSTRRQGRAPASSGKL